MIQSSATDYFMSLFFTNLIEHSVKHKPTPLEQAGGFLSRG